MADNKSRAFVLEPVNKSNQLFEDFGLKKFNKKYEYEEAIYGKYKDERKNGEKKKSVDISNLSLNYQAWETSAGEYIRKPYNQEKLGDLVEICGKLKSCIESKTTGSVGLGLHINPFGHPNVKKADFTEEEESIFLTQRKSLVMWIESKCKKEDFYTICEILERKKLGLGEAYLEVITDPVKDDVVLEIKPVDPRPIWVGKNKDRYIQVINGKKTYFRPFFEENPMIRSKHDFEPPTKEKPVAIEDQATKLIHFKEYNIASDTYGIPVYTPHIPSILGARASDERNKAFFDNDAVPRMAVTISGGSLSEETLEIIRNFFTQTKGTENAHRVLILEVSALNTNSPDWKPPVVEITPLTVGRNDDASFLGYKKSVEDGIREAFKLANIFLGNAEDVNRAAAFTLREMTVNLCFLPEGEKFARVLNNTLLKSWMKENKLTPETCLVQFGFTVPETMSQKDKAEMVRYLAAAGALAPNDIRTEFGKDTWDTPWAKIPTALAIVFAQMGLISTPSLEEFGEGIETGDGSSAIPSDSTEVGDIKERMAIRQMFKVLEKFFGGEHVSTQDLIRENIKILNEKENEDNE